jgi:hypothetical protein
VGQEDSIEVETEKVIAYIKIEYRNRDEDEEREKMDKEI